MCSSDLAKFIPHLDGFARSWLHDRHAFAMFTPSDWEAFRGSHSAAAAEMAEIARDPRRVIVKKP